jgi:polysaccharide export outer membrane protein
MLAAPLLLILALPAILRAQGTSGTLQQLQQNPQIQLPASARPATGVMPSPAPEGLADMKLAPGSLVDVQVFEEPDLNGSYRLDDRGQISMPFAGAIPLDSLTLLEAGAAITAKLESEQVLKAPHVVVNIDEYSVKSVVVLGEVAAPGRFPILGPRKLMDVLAMAGGQTPSAGNEIVVHRLQDPPEVTETVLYGRGAKDPKALNLEIRPGDTVLVKRVGIVYVLGSVFRPGGYAMQEAGELNLDQALALAQGTLPEAKVQNTLIIRKMPDGSLMSVEVNYKKINKGQASSPQLKPEDIVFVPLSGWKFTALHAIGVVAGVATATVYRVP